MKEPKISKLELAKGCVKKAVRDTKSSVEAFNLAKMYYYAALMHEENCQEIVLEAFQSLIFDKMGEDANLKRIVA